MATKNPVKFERIKKMLILAGMMGKTIDTALCGESL